MDNSLAAWSAWAHIVTRWPRCCQSQQYQVVRI